MVKPKQRLVGVLLAGSVLVGCSGSGHSSSTVSLTEGTSIPALTGGNGFCAKLTGFGRDLSKVQVGTTPSSLKSELSAVIHRYQGLVDSAPPALKPSFQTFLDAVKSYRANLTGNSAVNAQAQAQADAVFGQKAGPAANTITRWVSVNCHPAH